LKFIYFRVNMSQNLIEEKNACKRNGGDAIIQRDRETCSNIKRKMVLDVDEFLAKQEKLTTPESSERERSWRRWRARKLI